MSTASVPASIKSSFVTTPMVLSPCRFAQHQHVAAHREKDPRGNKRKKANKTKQNKTKQNKTKQNKTKQNKTKQKGRVRWQPTFLSTWRANFNASLLHANHTFRKV